MMILYVFKLRMHLFDYTSMVKWRRQLLLLLHAATSYEGLHVLQRRHPVGLYSREQRHEDPRVECLLADP